MTSRVVYGATVATLALAGLAGLASHHPLLGRAVLAVASLAALLGMFATFQPRSD
ncbi:hypothetical protein [Actinopolymorpha pittospori]